MATGRWPGTPCERRRPLTFGEHRPTSEQHNVVEAALTGENVVIEAGAGTGKTSTLTLVADQLKGRGVYIAFNRQIVDEAQRKFGDKVACFTAHQLAYESVGYLYQSRLDGCRRMPYDEVAREVGLRRTSKLSDGTPVTPYQAVRHAFAAVKAYCRSADDTLLLTHVPAW